MGGYNAAPWNNPGGTGDGTTMSPYPPWAAGGGTPYTYPLPESRFDPQWEDPNPSFFGIGGDPNGYGYIPYDRKIANSGGQWSGWEVQPPATYSPAPPATTTGGTPSERHPTFSIPPLWTGGDITGRSGVGSYSPVPTDTGGVGQQVLDWLKGIFGGGGQTTGGGSNANYYNMMFPSQNQTTTPFPFFLPYPTGSGGNDADFSGLTNQLKYLTGQANPWFMNGMGTMGSQLGQGYGTGSQLGQEGYNQLLLGGNLAEQLGMGKGISTPQQQQLQSSIMGNVNTGGLTPETVAAMQRLILEPQQEQFMGNINKLAGGGALLTSPAYQEMVRRNDQNFTDQMLASAYQNMPQYYNLANQITSQPMQQGMNLGNLFGNLGQAAGLQGLGYYGAAGNLGLGMNQVANNAQGNILGGYTNMYNTQQGIANAQNIASAQSMGAMYPYLMANAAKVTDMTWPGWPTTTNIPGVPTSTGSTNRRSTTPATSQTTSPYNWTGR